MTFRSFKACPSCSFSVSSTELVSTSSLSSGLLSIWSSTIYSSILGRVDVCLSGSVRSSSPNTFKFFSSSCWANSSIFPLEMSCTASLLLLALRSVCPIGSPRVQSRQSKVTHFVSLVGDDAEEHFVGTNQSSDETRRFSRWTTVTSLSLVWDPTRVSRPLFAFRYLDHFL